MWWWSNPPKTIYTIKCIVRNREKGTAGTTQQQSPAKFQVSLKYCHKKTNGENMTVERKIERKIEELEGQVLFQENMVSGIIYQLNIYEKKRAEKEDKKERYWEMILEAIDELTIEKRKLEHKMNELKSLKENNLKKGENMKYETVKKIAEEYDGEVVIQSAQDGVDVEDAEYFFLCFKYPAEKIRPFEDELVRRFEELGYDVSWCPEPEEHGEEFEAVLNLL